jgi:hypothetical protein
MSLSHRLLDGSDREDALLDEQRDDQAEADLLLDVGPRVGRASLPQRADVPTLAHDCSRQDADTSREHLLTKKHPRRWGGRVRDPRRHP